MRWSWRTRSQAIALIVVALLLGIVANALLNRPPQHETVGSYFDSPPAWPGEPWTNQGLSVSSNVLVAAAGPEHCGWQAVTFLTIGWPPGTRADTADRARQYLRDPSGSHVPAYLLGTWARNPPLPADARDTGFRYRSIKLYVAPSDEDRYVYLVAPSDSERWPRSDPMTLCQ